MVYHEPEPDVDILHPDVAPKWLRDALTSYRIQEDFIYQIMLDNPMSIEKAYWGPSGKTTTPGRRRDVCRIYP